MNAVISFFKKMSKRNLFLLGSGFAVAVFLVLFFCLGSFELTGSWYFKNKNYSERVNISSSRITITREGKNTAGVNVVQGTMDIKIKEYDNEKRIFKGIVMDSSGVYKTAASPMIYFRYRLEQGGLLAFGLDLKDYPAVAPFGFYRKDLSK